MHQDSVRRAGHSRYVKAAFCFLAQFAALALVLWSWTIPASAQATCGPYNVSVANGGIVDIDANACDGGFGINGTLPVPPQHGSVVQNTLTNIVTYTHNGDPVTSDTFVFEDGSARDITVNVTIGAASSIGIAPSSLAFTAGTFVSEQFVASGGTAPYSWSVLAGTLPAGLNFTSEGLLSGTPTARGQHSFTIGVTDNAGVTGQRSFGLTVEPAELSVIPDTINTVVGEPLNVTFSGEGGVSPHPVNYVSGPVPAGTSFSGATLSGTPTTVGTSTVTLQVFDSSTHSTGGPGNVWWQLKDVTITVAAAPTIVVSPATLLNPAVAASYSQSLTASGGTAPYSFAVTAGALPAGLSLVDNTVSGTPTAGGTFNFTVTATDSQGFEGTRAYTLVVAPPTIAIAPTTLPAPSIGTAYSQAISASGGTGSYTYAVTAGALPAGFSLVSGVLSGTPTAGGTFNFTLTASDSSTGTGPYTGSRLYTITVGGPTIILPPDTLPDGIVGETYSASLPTATGGTAPYTFSLASGTIPAGLIINANGSITGTPTVAGTGNFTARVTDSSTGTGPFTATQNYAITIGDNEPVANPSSDTVGYGSAPNPITLSLSGGATTSVAIASAPSNGTAIATETSITYQPAAGFAGNDSFTYTATGPGGMSAPAIVTITVSDPILTVSPAGPLSATPGISFMQTFTFAGGAAPYTAAAVTGLPDGLSVTGTTADSVTVAGTPTEAGTFTLTISALDSSTGTGPFSVSETVSLGVAAPALTISPPGSTLTLDYAAPFSQTFTGSGGTAPYIFAPTSGAIPPGMVFTSTGQLSGTPTVPGSYALTIRATDSTTGAGAPFSTSENYVLQVGAPTITLSPTTLSNAVAGSAYTATFTASGGSGPYAFSQAGGTLPTGLSLDPSGELSGTPTQSGAFSLTVEAEDGNGQTGMRIYDLTVTTPTLDVTPASLSPGVAGTAYSQALTASGGIEPYTFTVTGGALPAGIVVTSAGMISGTPTVAGNFSFSVTVTDSTAGTAASLTVNYVLDISPPAIALNPPTLPNGTVGTAYSQTITASGGTEPYTFSISAGALPTGVSLSSGGALSGTPSVPDNFNFTVTATDNLGFSNSIAYAVSTMAAIPVANSDTATTLGGEAVTIAVTDNDTGDIASISIVAAPANGTAVVDGTNIVYTPAATFSGSDTLQYTANGPGGTSAPASVNIEVDPRPIAASRRIIAIAGTEAIVDLSEGASGGPFTRATLVSLAPASAGTATLSGTRLTFTPDPSFEGTATATFTLSNAFATSDQAALIFDVEARPDPTRDPEVMGILNAQTAATRRFATSQIGNFQRRLESLRQEGGDDEIVEGIGFAQGVTLAFNTVCTEEEKAVTDETCGRRPKTDGKDALKSAFVDDGSANAPSSGRQHRLTVWTGGSINVGERDGADGFDFQTSGLSAGLDYRLGRNAVIGMGFGYGHDRSDVGSNGSRSTGESYTAAIYGSYHPGDVFFIDGLAGYQWLSFDSRRYLTSAGGFATGERDGGQWFASVSTGARIKLDEIQFSPYLRLDVAKARLDAFTEDGATGAALSYGRQIIDTTTANLGLTVNHQIPLTFGILTPQLRFEYQRDLQDESPISISYADVFDGPTYRTLVDGLGRDRFVLGLGANFETGNNTSLGFEYRGMFGSEGDSNHGFLLNVSKEF